MNQDRDRMHENWSGFSGIEQEDAVIAVSMGPVVDRTKEYLVAADQAVVYLRRRLLDSVRRVEGGGDPIGVSIADYTQLRALVDTVIDWTTRWQDVTPSRLDAKRAELSPA
jgi:phthalate 4,5-dioxygenase oxygenase subunit